MFFHCLCIIGVFYSWEPCRKTFCCCKEALYIHPSRAMRVLGSWVSGSSKTTIDVEHRISKARKAFHAQREKLFNKHVDTAIRIKAL